MQKSGLEAVEHKFMNKLENERYYWPGRLYYKS